jgi:hypothetical protein
MTSLRSRTGINAGRTETVRKLKENWDELLQKPVDEIERELSEYREVP